MPVELDKSKWAEGPWDDEPDEWYEMHGHFYLLIKRNHGGALCGYVGVPPDHPWYGKSDSDLYGYNTDDVDDETELPWDYPEVHGGLTYAGTGMRENLMYSKDGTLLSCQLTWWVGFDCGHLGDLTPAFANSPGLSGGEYRSLVYVQGQVRGLAEQAMNTSNTTEWLPIKDPELDFADRLRTKVKAQWG